jgi:hypothetical protein
MQTAQMFGKYGTEIADKRKGAKINSWKSTSPDSSRKNALANTIHTAIESHPSEAHIGRTALRGDITLGAGNCWNGVRMPSCTWQHQPDIKNKQEITQHYSWNDPRHLRHTAINSILDWQQIQHRRNEYV